MVMLPKRHLHSVTSQAPHATEITQRDPIWQSDSLTQDVSTGHESRRIGDPKLWRPGDVTSIDF